MAMLALVAAFAALVAASVSSPVAAGSSLVAVRCDPQCSWSSVDAKTGATGTLSRVPQKFETYVRPGIAAADAASHVMFWSFPQAPEGDVFTYSAPSNKTAALGGFSSGVVSLSYGSGQLLAIENPAANVLSRMPAAGGPVTKLLPLGQYNVSGHEYVSTLDIAGGRMFITGDDLTAHSAQLITVFGALGPAEHVKAQSVTYTGWAMLRMQWSSSLNKLFAMVHFVGSTSKLVTIDPASGATTVVHDFGKVIQRCEFAVDDGEGVAYILDVPMTLFTIDLSTGTMRHSAAIKPMFGAEVVAMDFV